MSELNVDIDLPMLESLRDLLGEKFPELIRTYNEDCAARISRMGIALENHDFVQINHEAHGVKGSSRNMGANSLALLCDQMETKAKVEDAVAMPQIFSAIEQEFAATAQQLNNLL
ncbi:Hpt domain-containing protein [Teredinibacter purpureus]|uniref:Hpt domain-containing protein n=1 Tax=Teredinibacter purpureus TaxID=2731756 RepID=UPI0005F81C2D|nr:Hpt domain-containing protein [Teredinibacter purpureus]